MEWGIQFQGHVRSHYAAIAQAAAQNMMFTATTELAVHPVLKAKTH
jgi:hypothetical protein